MDFSLKKPEGITFNIKEMKKMAKTVGKLPLYLNPEFPQELLQRR